VIKKVQTLSEQHRDAQLVAHAHRFNRLVGTIQATILSARSLPFEGRVMDNTSGEGRRAQVPAEIKRWSWGAFLLNWIWGIGNDTYIALLMFLPLVNVVMIFVLGAKGNVWAWRNRRWRDVEHFQRVQRKWAMWGFIIWGTVIVIYGGAILLFIWVFTHADAYVMAVERLTTNPVAISELGTPIRPGFPWGRIQVLRNGGGTAQLSFSVSGPKASGTVYVDARKDFGVWRLIRFELALKGRDQRINLGSDVALDRPSPPPISLGPIRHALLN
jgi:hypothetical protein